MFRLKMCHLQAYAIFPLPDAFPTLRSNSFYKSGTHVIKPSKYFFIFYKKCFTVCVLILKCFNFVTERCVDNKRIFNSESRCRITADIWAPLVFFLCGVFFSTIALWIVARYCRVNNSC